MLWTPVPVSAKPLLGITGHWENGKSVVSCFKQGSRALCGASGPGESIAGCGASLLLWQDAPTVPHRTGTTPELPHMKFQQCSCRGMWARGVSLWELKSPLDAFWTPQGNAASSSASPFGYAKTQRRNGRSRHGPRLWAVSTAGWCSIQLHLHL